MGEKMPSIWIINGPNLNKLGVRQPELYGVTTLGRIEAECQKIIDQAGGELVFKQSSFEGDLINWVHEAMELADGVIINAGGYSHTSVALRDAISMLSIPVIDAHLTNINAREPFRQVSLISSAATGMIAGFGENSYKLAVQALLNLIHQKNKL